MFLLLVASSSVSANEKIKCSIPNVMYLNQQQQLGTIDRHFCPQSQWQWKWMNWKMQINEHRNEMEKKSGGDGADGMRTFRVSDCDKLKCFVIFQSTASITRTSFCLSFFCRVYRQCYCSGYCYVMKYVWLSASLHCALAQWCGNMEEVNGCTRLGCDCKPIGTNSHSRESKSNTLRPTTIAWMDFVQLRKQIYGFLLYSLALQRHSHSLHSAHCRTGCIECNFIDWFRFCSAAVVNFYWGALPFPRSVL